jgi:hypothetical protein
MLLRNYITASAAAGATLFVMAHEQDHRNKNITTLYSTPAKEKPACVS